MLAMPSQRSRILQKFALRSGGIGLRPEPVPRFPERKRLQAPIVSVSGVGTALTITNQTHTRSDRPATRAKCRVKARDPGGVGEPKYRRCGSHAFGAIELKEAPSHRGESEQTAGSWSF